MIKFKTATKLEIIAMRLKERIQGFAYYFSPFLTAESTEDTKKKAEIGSQTSEVRGRRSEVRSLWSELYENHLFRSPSFGSLITQIKIFRKKSVSSVFKTHLYLILYTIYYL